MRHQSIKNIVLVIDGGGRGSVLVDAYAHSPQVERILAIPGNDLMKMNVLKSIKTYPQVKTTDISKILKICQTEQVSLVDVAQDNAVAAGLVDALIEAHIPVIGPTQAAGQIEWDKAWSREFMLRHKLPSPQYKICHSSQEGLDFIKGQTINQWFVKAAGLAEGKGVIPAPTKLATQVAIGQMSRFGESGKTYLLESWLVGEEFSAFAICDGKDFQIVGYAQDHKRAFNFEQGENTGGMGAVSRPLIVTAQIEKQVVQIFQKTLAGLQAENRPYIGILYLGAMVVKGKVFVIEFNARWGDPEAQVIVPSFGVNFFKLNQAILTGKVAQLKLKPDKKVRIVVAGAARGYPTDYSAVKAKQIYGLEELQKASEVKLYGAGVKKLGRKYVVNGGRLFYLVGQGQNVSEARQKVYAAMAKIQVEDNNLHYRTDIGWRDMERLQNRRNLAV